MALNKDAESKLPFKLGCGDEIEVSVLQLALEDLSVMCATALNTSAFLTTSAAAAMAKNKEKDAEITRTRGAMAGQTDKGGCAREEETELKMYHQRKGHC